LAKPKRKPDALGSWFRSQWPRPASTKGVLSYRLNKKRLRIVRRREGRYLLRSNLLKHDPGQFWELYIQLTQIEENRGSLP
jgi:hypothetical protein